MRSNLYNQVPRNTLNSLDSLLKPWELQYFQLNQRSFERMITSLNALELSFVKSMKWNCLTTTKSCNSFLEMQEATFFCSISNKESKVLVVAKQFHFNDLTNERLFSWNYCSFHDLNNNPKIWRCFAWLDCTSLSRMISFRSQSL